MIALGHRTDLRHRLVTFIDKQQRVVRQIFEQRRWRFTRQPSGQKARVIFDAGAAAGGRDHLEIEIGSLFQPLMLYQLAFRFQFLEPDGKLEFDRFHRLFHRRPRRDVVRIGIDPYLVQGRALLPGQRIKFDNLFNLVAEKADPPGHVLVMRREYLEIIASNPEIAAGEGHVIAFILQRHQLADDIPLVDRLVFLEIKDHRRIGLDRTDTV